MKTITLSAEVKLVPQYQTHRPAQRQSNSPDTLCDSIQPFRPLGRASDANPRPGPRRAKHTVRRLAPESPQLALMGSNLLCNMSNSYAQLYIGAIPLDNTALIESEPTPLHQLVSSDPRFVFVYSSVGW
jgi:hypothetical protein